MSDAQDEQHQVTVYAAVGGQPFFDHLVDRFYERVADDEVLLSLYPDQVDLAPARRRLSMFLAQYWGGPDTYSSERGHPRLRMRHLPFTIDPTAAEHWVARDVAGARRDHARSTAGRRAALAGREPHGGVLPHRGHPHGEQLIAGRTERSP